MEMRSVRALRPLERLASPRRDLSFIHGKCTEHFYLPNENTARNKSKLTHKTYPLEGIDHELIYVEVEMPEGIMWSADNWRHRIGKG